VILGTNLIFILYSPWRIVEDAGTGFAMGSIAGSILHAIKGFKNSPRVSQEVNLIDRGIDWLE
jgi:hypothetical protein